jgi:hypothetical protein
LHPVSLEHRYEFLTNRTGLLQRCFGNVGFIGRNLFGMRFRFLIHAMSLTIFIALCLLGSKFMLYVLFHWIRDTQPNNSSGSCEGTERNRKEPHVVIFSKTSRNRVNVPTATDNELLDIGQGARRFESSLHYSERIAYERIARCLTLRKRA